MSTLRGTELRLDNTLKGTRRVGSGQTPVYFEPGLDPDDGTGALAQSATMSGLLGPTATPQTLWRLNITLVDNATVYVDTASSAVFKLVSNASTPPFLAHVGWMASGKVLASPRTRGMSSAAGAASPFLAELRLSTDLLQRASTLLTQRPSTEEGTVPVLHRDTLRQMLFRLLPDASSDVVGFLQSMLPVSSSPYAPLRWQRRTPCCRWDVHTLVQSHQTACVQVHARRVSPSTRGRVPGCKDPS